MLFAGMLVIGIWVTRQIEKGVTQETATATALYAESVIAPLLGQIGEEGLPLQARHALDQTLSTGVLGRRLASFKIWKEGGLIVYSSRPELIGQKFEPTPNLRAAWGGQVTAEFDRLNDEEDALERAQNIPLLEIYSPIREPWSGEVVAVAEFYEVAHELQRNLKDARLRSWLVVGMVTLCMIGLLFGIVLRGSDMIVVQRRALEARVAELSRLLRRNEMLRMRVQGASGRAAALNERYLKRISADLHDGPAQLLALASLRLGAPRISSGRGEEGEIDAIRTCLDEAMAEIRNICRGLTLPHIEMMKLSDLLKTAASEHAGRTGTDVSLRQPEADPMLSASEKICIFRFVQEGLNNAFHHAGGVGQVVAAELSQRTLEVSVGDEGPGFDVSAGLGDGLGLAGLRDRVESLGGEFRVGSSSSGVRLTMLLKLEKGAVH